MKTAIITGASAGLGIDFFREIVRRNPEITDIWLIARRLERLEALAAQFPERTVLPVALDLTDPESEKALGTLLAEKKPEVALLINNAGCGTFGDFAEAETESQLRMIDLNIRALTMMTAVVLPYMKSGSRIINTCSIASFAPNPRMTVYSSTKAYVMSFSRGLRFELKNRGIGVLAVCPGPMRTEFLPIANIQPGSSKTFDTLPYCDPQIVARNALRMSERGRAVYTPKVFFKFYRFVAKVLPHAWVMHFSKA